ncbi:MAG: transposase [Deltaproteobacteria bacterium]|nr:transposase [Deltaproteobacteria bacterium]
MARPLRLEIPGAVYHLTSRGNARQEIYRDVVDRETFLALLGQVCTQWRWQCYAYCLMNNHYHLVVETLDGRLAAGMRQLNGVYTQHFNRLHRRTGHLFQGRYKAILVERESSLLTVLRHVVLNPVRARLVRRPERWRWSSYRAAVGLAPAPNWLQVAWVWSQFSQRPHIARQRYATFVAEGLGQPSVWTQLRQQIFLGSEEFVTTLQNKLGPERDLSEIPREQRRNPPAPLTFYEGHTPDRAQAMALAYHSGAYTLKAIARHFGVHYSTVSRAVSRFPQETSEM